MKKLPTILSPSELDDFSTDHSEIINSFEKPIMPETQWKKQGDFFQKLSMYDHSYISIESSGSSSLKV